MSPSTFKMWIRPTLILLTLRSKSPTLMTTRPFSHQTARKFPSLKMSQLELLFIVSRHQTKTWASINNSRELRCCVLALPFEIELCESNMLQGSFDCRMSRVSRCFSVIAVYVTCAVCCMYRCLPQTDCDWKAVSSRTMASCWKMSKFVETQLIFDVHEGK
jgi:hypothetical protein